MPEPEYIAPPDRFPPRLASLGYRAVFLNDSEAILPPVCDVPAGPFLMGSNPDKDKNAFDIEQPQHRVTLPAYQIAKYPVTVAEYASFLRAARRAEPKSRYNPLTWAQQMSGRLDHPVVNVSWHDAMAYARWLAERTSQSWRLSSEAEWEKAARGTDGRIYPWGDQFDISRCNTHEGGRGGTTPVGGYPGDVSPYGAQEMAGNVWEWAGSLYKPYPYISTDGRERGRATQSRSRRGSSWYGAADAARAAYRNRDGPGVTLAYLGFRLARSDPNS